MFSIRLFYFAYLAALGLMVTYWPIQMTAIGLSATQVGMLFTGRTAVSIVSQPLLTRWAEARGAAERWLSVGMVAGFLISLGVLVADSFAELAAVMWLSAIPLSAAIPMVDVAALRRVGISGYGHTRLWGSVGYGLVVCGLGALTGRLTAGAVGQWALWGFLFWMTVTIGAVFSFAHRPAASAEHATSGPPPRREGPAEAADGNAVPVLAGAGHAARRTSGLPAVVRSKMFVLFVVANLLHWASVTEYNVFLSLATEAMALPLWVPGASVGFAIAGEILAFAGAGRFLARYGSDRCLVWALVATFLRWVITALAADAMPLAAIQTLHFFSYGLWFAACLAWLERIAPGGRRASVQGIFAAGATGAGSLVGSALGSATIWLVGVQYVFWCAAMLSLSSIALLLLANRAAVQEEASAA